MAYTKQLPPVRELLRLAQQSDFPTTGRDMEQMAVEKASDPSVVDFLRLFAPDTVFRSRADFMTRCEELELLIGQERLTPIEVARSPQD